MKIGSFFILILLMSCQTKVSNELFGKTFYRMTKEGSGYILYEYCNANINTIKVMKDSIFEDIGQEDIIMNIKKIEKNEKFIKYKVVELAVEYDFKLIDSINGYWEINNEMYVDSVNSHKLKKVEQPCTDCFEKEMCDEWAREAKEKEVEVRYDQLRDSLQKLNTQIPEKWQGVYSYLVSDEGLTAGGSSTSVWETFTVTQDSIISERQGYMADFTDNYLPAIKYPDTLYMYLDRCLNRDGKPKYYSSSLKPDVLYKKGDTFYLNDRKLDYRPLNE